VSLLILLVILGLFIGMRVLVTIIGWIATLISIALLVFLLRLLAGWWLK